MMPLFSEDISQRFMIERYFIARIKGYQKYIPSMNPVPSPPLILWRQIGSLAAVQGAITLCWLIYRVYLPQMLASFGFPGLEKAILIFEDFLAVIIEPCMGGFSDRQRQWMGSRFPVITLGVILASAFFVIIPVVFIFGQPITALHWVLPVVAVLWAMAMALFRSPAVALLGQYAVETKWPQAMSLLILVGGLAGAAKPIAGNFILSLGPAVPFVVGSLVLLGAVALLRSVNPDAAVVPAVVSQETLGMRDETETNELTGVGNSAEIRANQPLSLPLLGLIAATGMAVALGSRITTGELLPQVLKVIPGVDVKLLMTGIFIVLAIAALPAGNFAARVGNEAAMQMGLVATAILLPMLVTSQTAGIVVGLVIVLIGSYCLVVNSAIPFVLSLVPPHRGGLGIGIYFGGFSLTMSLYSLWMSPLMPMVEKGIVGSVAFLCAAVFVLIGSKLQH